MTRHLITLAVPGTLLLAARAVHAHSAPAHVHLADGAPVFIGLGLAALVLCGAAGIALIAQRRTRARRRAGARHRGGSQSRP